MSILHISSSLPVRAYSCGLFISQGKERHAERVINSFELIFVRKGTLSMHEDGIPFTVTAGQTLLLWPGRRHGGTVLYPDDLQFYWLHFDVLDTNATDGIQIPQLAEIDRTDYLTMLFRTYLDNQGLTPQRQVSADLLLMLILSEVACSTSNKRSDISPAKTRLAERARGMIRMRSCDNISTSDIAGELDVNPDYLGRVYHAAYGRTIIDAIHERRIQRAKMLLIETEDTVDSIASACGFDNTGYFRRIFQRSEGMSPRKYRQLYCRVHVNTE